MGLILIQSRLIVFCWSFQWPSYPHLRKLKLCQSDPSSFDEVGVSSRTNGIKTVESWQWWRDGRWGYCLWWAMVSLTLAHCHHRKMLQLHATVTRQHCSSPQHSSNNILPWERERESQEVNCWSWLILQQSWDILVSSFYCRVSSSQEECELLHGQELTEQWATSVTAR